MKTYKVYFRYRGKADSAYVEADSLDQVKWKVLSRFYYSTINKIVETK